MKPHTIGCSAHAPLFRPVKFHLRQLGSRPYRVSTSLATSSQCSRSKQLHSRPCCTGRNSSSHKQLKAAPCNQARSCVARFAHSQSSAFDGDLGAPLQGKAEAHISAKVPWTWKQFVSVSLLWLLGFWVLGYLILPGLMDLVGLDKDDLSITSQAVYHVVFDVCQLGLTIRILLTQLKAFRPLQLGWFRIRALPLKQWLGPVIAGAATFPVLNWAAQLSQAWFPDDLWTQNLEQSIVRGDSTSNVLYFAVLIFCAPIWEEAMFRGFMLPSLTKYMPTAVALLITSAIFAILHFSVQRFVPLVLLGIVLGVVYLRTRNLIAPIALHSLWNMYIFYNLLMRGSGILGGLFV